jgi:hypothetical protein
MRLLELEHDNPSEIKGSYAAALFDDDTAGRLAALVDDHGIPNAVAPHEFHATIVHSRTPVFWRPEHDTYQTATPSSYEVWKTQDGKNCLVLRVESPYLQTRFNLGMARGASYDFDEYKPHVTLSYDVGEDFDPSSLPLPDYDLIIDRERYEPLDI